MSNATLNSPKKKDREKIVPESFSWPASCKAKILEHQSRMVLVLKRKVTLPEAFAHFVANAEFPAIIAK